ncbi:MAG: hypothetical protein WBS18_07950, partial [Candidatus Acidiferrales bacterium]
IVARQAQRTRPGAAIENICRQGEIVMQKLKLAFVGLGVFALLLSVTAAQDSSKSANFVGTWDVTMSAGGQRGGQGGGQGANGSQGDGQNGNGNQGDRGQRRGMGPQSLTITQNGDKYKVDHKTPRGENSYDAAVSGNTISWTEDRPGRDGNTRTINFKATLDGDTLSGTMGGGRFSRDFTATRAAAPTPDAK